MYSKNALIAAAVAGALASTAAQAYTAPTVSDAANNSVATLVIAGSSAAKTSVYNAIENGVCGGVGNALVVNSSGNANFGAVSCYTDVFSANFGTDALVTFYYRSEGGSVVGALPIATGYQPLRLDLGQCTSGGVCTVNGTTSTNGPADSWTGAVKADVVQLGVTDVEPKQLINLDYPNNYKSTVWGHATAAQMAGLGTVAALQQVFGIAVNTGGIPLDTTHNSGINLSKESVAGILTGAITDWSHVPDSKSGYPIATASSPITVINREPGSGTRTSANIYFLNYQCGATKGIPAPSNATVYYATGDELGAAVLANGSLSYASIDNLAPYGTKFTTLTMATINGVVPSNLSAAAGQYDYWYEATLVPNPATSGNSLVLSNYLTTNMPNLAQAPVAADINVIPGAGTNVASLPLGQTTGSSINTVTSGSTSIYINPYSRNGNSCNIPTSAY